MRYLFLVLSLVFGLQFQSQAQHMQSKGLSITATGEVELPADQIRFNINVNAEADSPQAAYELHQQREDALVKLLETYEIEQEDIHYEPVSISKVRDYDRQGQETPVYRTQQTVVVNLRDFEVYEKIQVGLIEHNFDNFSGSFSSTEYQAGKDQALRNAIEQAQSQAQLMAETAGIKVGPILQMSYSHDRHQPVARDTFAMKAESQSGSLLQYEQTVTVTATVSMRFAIIH